MKSELASAFPLLPIPAAPPALKLWDTGVGGGAEDTAVPGYLIILPPVRRGSGLLHILRPQLELSHVLRAHLALSQPHGPTAHIPGAFMPR